MQRIGRRRLEIEVPVELFSLIVFGVNQDRPCTDLVGRRGYSSHGVLQKSATKPLATLRDIYRKSGKQDHRDRVAGETLLNPLRSLVGLYASRSERVVADHAPGSMHNVDPRRAGLVTLESIAT